MILGTQFKAYYLYALALILGGLFIQNRYSKMAPKYIGAKHRTKLPFYDVTGAFIENTHPHIEPHIRGNGRVLAAKLKASDYTGIENKDKHSCFVFTNKEPPESVRREELRFIEEILAPEQDEIVVMAAGNVTSVEQALNEHA